MRPIGRRLGYFSDGVGVVFEGKIVITAPDQATAEVSCVHIVVGIGLLAPVSLTQYKLLAYELPPPVYPIYALFPLGHPGIKSGFLNFSQSYTVAQGRVAHDFHEENACFIVHVNEPCADGVLREQGLLPQELALQFCLQTLFRLFHCACEYGCDIWMPLRRHAALDVNPGARLELNSKPAASPVAVDMVTSLCVLDIGNLLPALEDFATATANPLKCLDDSTLTPMTIRDAVTGVGIRRLRA
jgi:hypothetical protein